MLNPLVCWCSTIPSCSYFTEQSNSGNHGNKVQLTPAVFSYVPTTLQWSIPFQVQNFWLFLARTIKLAPPSRSYLKFRKHCNSYTTLKNLIQHTTISQQSACGITQITLINVTLMYMHSVQATVNYSWNLFAHHSTTIMHHLYNIHIEVIVWYSAWQKPKHAPCQDACSVLTVHVSTKYFNKRK